MGDNDGEVDLFDDDDDFDNLSESALRELEHNAILSQRQKSQTNVLSKSVFAPRPRSNLATHLLNHTENYFDDDSFELVGDEGVATPVEEYDAFPSRPQMVDETAQRERFRQQRYGESHSRPIQSADRLRAPYQRPSVQALPADGRYHGVSAISDQMVLDQASQQVDDPQGGDPSAFRARFEALTRERDQLAKDLRAANEAVSMQKGEISIIRANAEKENKVFDRQITSLKKSMEEEAIKQKAAMDAVNDKNRQLTTRYQFLQQEHNQEIQDVKALKQRLKDRPDAEGPSNFNSTPKRGMAGSLRDGFDDDDVMLLSPSKSARRSKPSTPTGASKRKRKAGGTSPVKALPLRLSGAAPDISPARPSVTQLDIRPVIIVRKDHQTERDLRFLQSILDYRVKTSREILVESLMKFSLPSKASKTFSNTLLDGIARLNDKRAAYGILQIFIDLWLQSIKAHYYQPIPVLQEIVYYIIDVEMFVLDKAILTDLVPLLQASISLNAEKRFKHSPVNHSSFGKFRATPQSVLIHEVDGTACLDLLLTVAYTVSDEPELIDLFWRLMDPEYVLMMLNAWQPISDITLNLRLLATSIFPNTFGSIARTLEEQEKIEHWIVNRVCWLLWETPKVDEGLPPNTPHQLCQLRLEVMDLLTQIAITSSPYPHDDPNHHGSLLIASDAHAIARIVRSLYDEVAAMYLLTPTHALHAEIVNRGVRVFHHVLTMHSATIDLQEKLSLINGGVHKHRVVLTRLAFSQGFFIDRLITDDTVAMATSLLEDSVTPDEADELIEAFPGFKGRSSQGQAEAMDVDDA